MRSRWPGRALRCGWVLLWAGLPSAAPAGSGAPVAVREVLHIAFSEAMFSDVNLNDAKAALRVWAETVAREAGAHVDTDTRVVSGVEELQAGLRDGSIDAAATTTIECLAIRSEVALDPLFTGLQDGVAFEEYVLLVHREGGAERVGDLEGARLLLWENPRTCLADDWLRVVLADEGLKAPKRFFGAIDRPTKLSAAVLPVFFRQVPACVVTRRGWNLMSELNPQVGLQLRELRVSPRLVTITMFFRADYASPNREAVMQALHEMHKSPGGRQLLSMFKGDALQESPWSILDSARDLRSAAAAARRAEGPVTAAGSRSPARPLVQGGQP